MAVISSDHADESMCAEIRREIFTGDASIPPRMISREELESHNGPGGGDGSFWCVIDGFVVDATEFVECHPGGLKKLLAADLPGSGATGKAFGFSFSRGRNA